ncbi:MAG: hypothetical protein COA79_09680 [Planctomycetota bacterium]|nr:MAG: hypothetical protein COA79_09680 [Planctomycetota bacterium]
MKQSLLDTARTNKFEDLENGWLELMISNIARTDLFLTVAEILRARSHGAKAASLLTQLIDELYSQKKWDVLQEVLYYCAEKYSKMRDLKDKALECIRSVNSDNELLDTYLEQSGLAATGDLFSSWKEFNTYSYLVPGKFVLHTTQFGAGMVTEADPKADTIKIDFFKKKNHNMGLKFAARVLQPIASNHYYAHMIRDEELILGLKENNQAELVKIVALSFRGEVLVSKIKEELCNTNRVKRLFDLKAEPKSWTSWWGKAKRVIAKDKFLTLTAGLKGTVTARTHELSYSDEAAENIHLSQTVYDKITIIKNYLKDHGENEATPLFEALEEDLAKSSNQPETLEILSLFIDGKYKIEEHKNRFQEILESFENPLEKFLDPGKILDSPFMATLAAIKNNDTKKNILDYIKKNKSDAWLKLYHYIAHIDDTYLWAQTTGALQKENPALLMDILNSIFLSPDKFPGSFYRLIRDAINDKIELSESVSKIDVLRKAIFFLEIVSVNPHTKTIQQNVPKFFAEKKCNKLFLDYIQTASKEEIEPIFRSLTSRDERLESKMRAAILRVVSRSYPVLIKRVEIPYWENEKAYYITGISKKRLEDEVENIVNVKLPENSKAIGEAQALGDLSENAEFDAAKEERERLNQRAKHLKSIIESTTLIESINRAGEMVELGTKVTVKNNENNEFQTFQIMGAQEANSENKVLNYKAPFAWSMLGTKLGDSFSVSIENGADKEYTVESIQVLDI